MSQASDLKALSMLVLAIALLDLGLQTPLPHWATMAC